MRFPHVLPAEVAGSLPPSRPKHRLHHSASFQTTYLRVVSTDLDQQVVYKLPHVGVVRVDTGNDLGDDQEPRIDGD